MLESSLKATAADIAGQASVGPNPIPGGPPVANSLSQGFEPFVVESIRKMLNDEFPSLRENIYQEIVKLKIVLGELSEEFKDSAVTLDNLFFDLVARIDQHLRSYHTKQADPASK